MGSLIAVFSKAAQVFSVAVAFLPAVLRAIIALEASWPETGKGGEKRQIIRDGLETALEITSDGKVTLTEVWPLIERFIARKVAEYNQSGWPKDVT